MKILFVDDDEICRKTFKIMMEDSDIECDILKSGINLLNEYDVNLYDLIITDIEMPGINGFELAKKIKEYPEFSNIPIIGITGYDFKEFDNKYFDLILQKPINKEDLINVIRNFDYKEKSEDSELMSELLKVFNKDSLNCIKNIKTLYGVYDWGAIAYQAHKLKGAASYVFAEKVKNITDKINKEIKQRQYENIEHYICELEAELNDFLANIKAKIQ